MHVLHRFACIASLASTFAPAAIAASGGIDSFTASATQVTLGATVDFTVTFSLGTTSWTGGGSNPVEPPPQEGYQEWNVNWYAWEHETLRSVWLQSGPASFSDYPAVSAGDSYANSWSFSVTFTETGTFAFDLTGGWQSDVNYGYSNESASRTCYVVDPDAGGELTCDGWTWHYSDADDWYSQDGSLYAPSLSIEVVAPSVPEPASWALMLAGAGLLGAVVRRRG